MAIKRTPYTNPHAPIMTPVKFVRSVIKTALMESLGDGTKKGENPRAIMIRRFLKRVNSLELVRPDTVSLGLYKSGSNARVWVYEPDIAPASQSSSIILTWTERWSRALILVSTYSGAASHGQPPEGN
jgi:hypothetical protein